MGEVCTNNVPDTVSDIGAINIKGNVIPQSWYQHVHKKTKTGSKPYHLAISVLAEIVYWYRPTSKQNKDGSITSTKKFKADMLQKNYNQLCEKFFEEKKTIKRAVDFLVTEGYILREFRNIKANGRILNNVMYVEPVAEKVSQITSISTSQSHKIKDIHLCEKLGTTSIHLCERSGTSDIHLCDITPIDPVDTKSEVGEGDFCQETPDKFVNTNTNITTNNNIYTPPELLTPAAQEKTTLQVIQKPINKTRNKSKSNEWFMIPNKLEAELSCKENLDFLNSTDEKIVAFLVNYLENQELGEYLSSDINTIFKFAKENKISKSLHNKLKNIEYILDKFSAEQYIKAYEIAQSYNKDLEKKLSYIRGILTKAWTPKVISFGKKITKPVDSLRVAYA